MTIGISSRGEGPTFFQIEFFGKVFVEAVLTRFGVKSHPCVSHLLVFKTSRFGARTSSPKMSDEIMHLTGFYGQFSVLMFMTSAWYAVHGLVFAFVFAYIESRTQQANKAADTAAAVQEEATSDYQPMETPAPRVKNDGDNDDYVKVV